MTRHRDGQGLEVVATEGWTDDEVISLAAAVVAQSGHPIAQAILKAAAARVGSIPEASGFTALPGLAMEATVHGAEIAVGGPALLRRLHLTEPESLAAKSQQWRNRRAAVLYIVQDISVAGALFLTGGALRQTAPSGGAGPDTERAVGHENR